MRKCNSNASLTSVFNAAAIFAICLFALSASVLAAAASASYISEGVYSLRLHDDQNRCVNVIYASTAEDRAEIGVDPYNSEKNEQFRIVARGSNRYSIHPMHAEHLCLNALLGNRTPGDKVTLHRYENGDKCSLWYFLKNSDGSYTIKNCCTNLVLDVTNGDYSTGSRIINWTSNGYLRAQGYRLNKISAGSANITPKPTQDSWYMDVSEGTYALKLHANKSLCLNVQYASTEEDRARICVDPYNGQGHELFIIKNRGSGYYSIHPSHASYLCINALRGNKTPGDKVTLHTYEANDACSLWRFRRNLDGSATIVNKKTGLVLDVTNGSYSTGNPVINWTSNGYLRAQAFHITRVSSNATIASAVTWQYPMTNAYVCGNDWTERYRARPSRPYHVGIDIASRNGDSAVYAAANGTVVKTGYNSENGSFVIIRHTVSGRTVYSFYAHLRSINTSANKTVNRGQKIGVFGNTGSSSDGRHLHFAITDTYKSSGGYVGYASSYSGNSARYSGVTYYNPHYVIKYNKLP